MNKRISIDPSVCHGKPVIKGTRILVSNILSSLAAGDSYDNIISDYPGIQKEDIVATLDFSSEMMNFESHPYREKVS